MTAVLYISADDRMRRSSEAALGAMDSDDHDKLPSALSQRTAYLLGRALARAQALGERDLQPLGVSPREYSVLAVLAESSPLSQTRIGSILGLDRTTILKLGASLERKRLVVRERDRNDRRAYSIALTGRRRAGPPAVLHAADRLRGAVLDAAGRRAARPAHRSALADRRAVRERRPCGARAAPARRPRRARGRLACAVPLAVRGFRAGSPDRRRERR